MIMITIIATISCTWSSVVKYQVKFAVIYFSSNSLSRTRCAWLSHEQMHTDGRKTKCTIYNLHEDRYSFCFDCNFDIIFGIYVTVHRSLRLCHPNTRIHRRPATPHQPYYLRRTDSRGRPLSDQSDRTPWRIEDAVVSSTNERRRHEVVLVPFAVRWTRLWRCCVSVWFMATPVVSKSVLWPVCQR